METRLPEVFVSYSSRDVEKVREVAAALEAEGVRIWRDQDQILGGENYGPRIVHGIRNARVLLLACSAASMRSKNVKQEIQLAWTYDIPYLPILLERTAYSEQVEYWLSGSQWVEVLDHPADRWLPRVLAALHGMGIRSGMPTAAAEPQQAMVPKHDQPFQELWRLAKFNDLFWPVPAGAPAVMQPKTRDLGAPQHDAEHRFALGTALQLRLDSPRDGHLTVIDFGTSGTVYSLCPSAFAPETEIRAGTVILPQPRSRFRSFVASGRKGREQVLAIVSGRPLGLDWMPGDPNVPARHLSGSDLEALVATLRSIAPDQWMAFATYFDLV